MMIELLLDGAWVDVTEHHIPAESCGCTPLRECDRHVPEPAVCPTCGGEGFVYGPNSDPSAIGDFCPACRCGCGKPSTSVGGVCPECHEEINEDQRMRERGA